MKQALLCLTTGQMWPDSHSPAPGKRCISGAVYWAESLCFCAGGPDLPAVGISSLHISGHKLKRYRGALQTVWCSFESSDWNIHDQEKEEGNTKINAPLVWSKKPTQSGCSTMVVF